jgi:hypothetical protein
LPSPEKRELAQRFFRKACQDRDAVEILSASEHAADAVTVHEVERWAAGMLAGS